MQFALWEWMVRGDGSASHEGKSGLAKLGWSLQDGKLKSSYGPYRARQLFNVAVNHEEGPIWTFERMGTTKTDLPDGRVVCVGGEHEDYYDPDFYIYNDVVVLGTEGEIEIYGYPKEVFPSTDFHTATLVDDELIVVGRLGHKGERRVGHTPVHRLDLSDYHIEEVPTEGEMPGWIFKHNAQLGSDGTILVEGGEVIRDCNGEELYRQNVEQYALDIQSGVWRQLTSRNWRQFRIRPADRKVFVLEDRPKPGNLLPTGLEHTVLQCDKWNGARIAVKGVTVDLNVGIWDVRVLVEGELPAQVVDVVVNEICARTEKAAQRSCSLDEL